MDSRREESDLEEIDKEVDYMGRLLQFVHQGNGPWQVFNNPSLDTGDTRIANDPIISQDPREFSVFAHGIDGRLLQFFYTGNGPWQVFNNPSLDTGDTRIAGDPVISQDPGEFSVFARGIDGR